MRAWENRPDTEVVDEPLYAYYLAHTGLDHPGRDEVIAAGETDWRRGRRLADRGRGRTGRRCSTRSTWRTTSSRDLPREWIASAAQRAADPRPGRGGRRRTCARARPSPPTTSAPPAARAARCSSASSVAGDRLGRLPARPGGLPALALRLRRRAVHRRDAVVAGRAARRATASGRRTGTTRSLALHRLRAATGHDGSSSRRRARRSSRRPGRRTSGCTTPAWSSESGRSRASRRPLVCTSTCFSTPRTSRRARGSRGQRR